MERNYIKIINKYQDSFDEIREDILSFINYYYDHKCTDTENFEPILNKCLNSLSKIIEYSLSCCNFKDKFKYDRFSLTPIGPEIFIKSEKIKFEYKFGIHNNYLFISSYLTHTNNFVFMNDDFWSDLISLSKIEGFEFLEIEKTPVHSKINKHLFCSNKSFLFKIVRNYILDTNYSDIYRLNSFIFKIDNDVDVEKTILQFIDIFNQIYKINYKLWKISN
jgi:hypothetical protein